MKRDFVTLNPNEKFDILSFEFEMLIEDQLTRSLSSALGKTVKEIYSAEKPLGDAEMELVKTKLKSFGDAPIYYVDNAGTVPQIVSTILTFAHTNISPYADKGLVVTIDHLLLTKGKEGEREKEIVDNLMQALISLKKYFASIGLRCIFVVLSQLNRDIESSERTSNKLLHYPTKNDIFAASSVYYCSDYVMITHRPAAISGISGFYGPEREEDGFPQGLPIRCPNDPSKTMIYWHVIKERFGNNITMMMVDDFKNSSVKEYKP